MSLLLKSCDLCGNQFVPTHFNQVYCCESCRYDSKVERQRRKRKGKKLGVDPVSLTTPTINDIVCSALEYKEKTGKLISYGYMVQKLEGSNV